MAPVVQGCRNAQGRDQCRLVSIEDVNLSMASRLTATRFPPGEAATARRCIAVPGSRRAGAHRTWRAGAAGRRPPGGNRRPGSGEQDQLVAVRVDPGERDVPGGHREPEDQPGAPRPSRPVAPLSRWCHQASLDQSGHCPGRPARRARTTRASAVRDPAAGSSRARRSARRRTRARGLGRQVVPSCRTRCTPEPAAANSRPVSGSWASPCRRRPAGDPPHLEPPAGRRGRTPSAPGAGGPAVRPAPGGAPPRAGTPRRGP